MANFKSVLEKYDAKGNRRMPTAEEDAIQPDTTLEGLLIGPGTAAASGIAKGVNRLLNKSAPKITAPKIGSKVESIEKDSALRKKYKDMDWSKTPYKQNPFEPSPQELERIAKQKNLSKLMAEGEYAVDKAVFNRAGEVGFEVGANFADSSKEKTAGKTAYKKGGSVSSRADGIAQRGKTKGRMC